jgi:hypothetical protein
MTRAKSPRSPARRTSSSPINGMKIAKRHSHRWTSLIPGYKVRDYGDMDGISVDATRPIAVARLTGGCTPKHSDASTARSMRPAGPYQRVVPLLPIRRRPRMGASHTRLMRNQRACRQNKTWALPIEQHRNWPRAVRDALIAFMAATAQAQAEATKSAQRAGIDHRRRAQPNAYLGRKPSYDLATFDRIRLALDSASPPSLSAIAKAEGLSKQAVLRLKQDPHCVGCIGLSGLVTVARSVPSLVHMSLILSIRILNFPELNSIIQQGRLKASGTRYAALSSAMQGSNVGFR